MANWNHATSPELIRRQEREAARSFARDKALEGAQYRAEQAKRSEGMPKTKADKIAKKIHKLDDQIAAAKKARHVAEGAVNELEERSHRRAAREQRSGSSQQEAARIPDRLKRGY